MRTIPLPQEFYKDENWMNNGNVGITDTRNSYDALEDVNKLLKPYGLELCIYDSGTSDYWFTIVGKRIDYEVPN